MSIPNLGFIGIIKDGKSIACVLYIEVIMLRGIRGIKDKEVIKVIKGVSYKKGRQSNASLP